MWVVQVNYGSYGWEDDCVEETRAEALQRLKEYRIDCKYPVRIKRYRGQHGRKEMEVQPRIKKEKEKETGGRGQDQNLVSCPPILGHDLQRWLV